MLCAKIKQPLAISHLFLWEWPLISCMASMRWRSSIRDTTYGFYLHRRRLAACCPAVHSFAPPDCLFNHEVTAALSRYLGGSAASGILSLIFARHVLLHFSAAGWVVPLFAVAQCGRRRRKMQAAEPHSSVGSVATYQKVEEVAANRRGRKNWSISINHTMCQSKAVGEPNRHFESLESHTLGDI